jgi:hypothetical protein
MLLHKHIQFLIPPQTRKYALFVKMCHIFLWDTLYMCSNTDSQLRRTRSNLKTLVVQLVKKLPHYMEAEIASSYLQNTIWSQLKLVHYIPYFLTLILILSVPLTRVFSTCFPAKYSKQISLSRAPCQVSTTFVNIYLKETVRCRQISVKMPNIDFYENPYGGKPSWSTKTDEQTDGRTDTQIRRSYNIRFSQLPCESV